MAKHRVTVWMGASAAILAAAGLTACSAPGAPQVDTVSAAPEAARSLVVRSKSDCATRR